MSEQKIWNLILMAMFIALVVSDSVPSMAEDWDGILCYAGKQANPKTCKSCVTVYTDYSILKRDCYDSLSSNEVQDCESSAEIKCHHCTEAFCNKGHPKHKCVECDSKTDANCMTNATKFAVDQCIYDSNELDDFYCYTKYNSTTGGNERGCVTMTNLYSECMHNKDTCKLCIASDANACNVNEFPDDRRKCIHCDTSRGDCPTQQRPELVGQYSTYCQNVTDSCAIINYGGRNNIMQMCATEMDEATKRYCNENQGQCIFCAGAHNCNLLNSDGSSPTTTTTTAPTTDQSNSTENEIITKQPSSGHQLNGHSILLSTTFMIISMTMHA